MTGTESIWVTLSGDFSLQQHEPELGFLARDWAGLWQWKHQILATRLVVSDKSSGPSALQKRISTKMESSEATKVFIWRKKSTVHVNRHTLKERYRQDTHRLKERVLLSLTPMAVWITFMEYFFLVSFGQSFWVAWFRVPIRYISGSSHVCACIS